jgi:hypothetical protein
MATTVHRALASMTQLFTTVTDHLSGADIVRADARNSAEAQQRLNARISALREGFTAIRERHEELNERIAGLTGRRRA